ncbi:MAG TPA: hypothetical protein VGJ05_22585 [Fimbriiglobus sp.]|jgi:hypothetical protein
MPRRIVALFAFLLPAAPAVAADDLLQWMPREARFVFVADRPREVIETLQSLPPLQAAKSFPQVRAVYESPGAKQFFQLLSHYEMELGAKWPELLDKLAGGGIAFGFDVLQDPAPTLLVVRGTDEAATAKALAILVHVVEDDGQTKVTHSTRHGAETVAIGPDLVLARVGPLVYVANKPAILDAGLALAESKNPADSVTANPTVAAAKAAVGPHPLAWAWLDFAAVKRTPKGKDFFENTRKDLFQTLVFGSSADAARRSDYLAAGFTRTADGLRFQLTLPAKRAELAKELGIHVPPVGTPGSLPLLEPTGVVYSQSFYLDLGKLWTDRKTIINDEVRGQLEKAEKQISRLLPGTTLGKLLQEAGPYHRIVFGYTGENLYATEPGRPIPVPAYVLSTRDPKFSKSMDGVLRTAALLAGGQFGGLKQHEEVIDGIHVVEYRFNEKPTKPVDDPDGIRFNLEPCFAAVGDSFVVAGSPGLLKKLIPELKKPAAGGSPAVWRNKIYGAGGAAFLTAHPDPIITETVLSQGVGLAEAKRQVAGLTTWLATLGTAEITIEHGKDAYTLKVEWNYK